MGLVPGTAVRVITIAPLGDPLRIEVRGGEWSIRRAEAAQIAVEPAQPAQPAQPAGKSSS
jgi:Fe2+ transport system protein FeoA